jgi:hypothetical protein
MITSTILFAVLLSQYIRIDSSHETKIEIFEAESEKIFKQIGINTIEIYLKELEHISQLINKVLNFFFLLDKTTLNSASENDPFQLNNFIVDKTQCGSMIEYMHQKAKNPSVYDYDFIQVNTEHQICLPCQVLGESQENDEQCENFKEIHFKSTPTHEFYLQKLGKYSLFFYNIFYLNQFYDLWNSATGIKKKFDFFKLFRLKWYMTQLFENYVNEKSPREHMLYLMGIMKKAVDTSQSQYLVSSYPSSEFSSFTNIDNKFFDLRNDIKLLSLTTPDNRKNIDLVVNFELNDTTRMFLMFDFYNISKHLLNTFEDFDLTITESDPTETTNNQIIFEDLNNSEDSFVTEKENDNDYTILRIKKNVRIYNRVITLEYSRRFQSRLKSKRFYLMNYIATQLVLPTILFIYIFLQFHIIKSLFIQRVRNYSF